MTTLKKTTERFVEETTELLDSVVSNCGIKNLANMSKEEFEMMQLLFKLMNTSFELIREYSEANEILNNKLDNITEMLKKVNKEEAKS